MRKNWKLGMKNAKNRPNRPYEIPYKIRNYASIFKWPMSTGPSSLGLPKKILIPKILQYTAEKMRKNLQKMQKISKFWKKFEKRTNFGEP